MGSNRNNNDFLVQVITFVGKMSCFGCQVDDEELNDSEAQERELVPLIKYKKLKFQDLNEDIKITICSFLGVKDLFAFASVNKNHYELVKERLGDYLSARFGIFNRGSTSMENDLALYALSCFYKGQDLYTPNREEAEKWYKKAYEGLDKLFVEKKKEWPHLFLAVMHAYGCGIPQNLSETKIHINALKNIWLREASRSLKNTHPELHRIFSKVLLSNYYETMKNRLLDENSPMPDESDEAFYEQHLRPFRVSSGKSY